MKRIEDENEAGKLVGFQGCLGYDYDVETKSISINEEGAVLYGTFLIDMWQEQAAQ